MTIKIFSKKENLYISIVIILITSFLFNKSLFFIINSRYILEKILIIIPTCFIDLIIIFILIHILKNLINKNPFVTFFDNKFVLETLFLPLSINYELIKTIQFNKKTKFITFKMGKDIKRKRKWLIYFISNPIRIRLKDASSEEIEKILQNLIINNKEIIYK